MRELNTEGAGEVGLKFEGETDGLNCCMKSRHRDSVRGRMLQELEAEAGNNHREEE